MIVKNPWCEKHDYDIPERCIIYNDGEYLIARRHEHEFMYIKKHKRCILRVQRLGRS